MEKKYILVIPIIFGGKKLDEPHLEVVEDFEEIDAPKEEK